MREILDAKQVDCFGESYDSPRNDESISPSLRDLANAKSWQSKNVSTNLANLNDICAEIFARISGKKCAIFLLQGDIGAGKTTLVQNFAKFVGIDECVTSPSFSLLHIYGDLRSQDLQDSRAKAQTIYHYDLYNASLEHALDLGLLDLLEQSAIHFVEWGDLHLFEILKNAFENICIIAISKTKSGRIYAFKEQI